MWLLSLACVDPPDEGASWQIVARDQPGAFMGLAAGPALVGSDVGYGPAAWTLDDGDWRDLALGGEGDLWWAHEADGVVWAAGSGGRLLRIEGEDVTTRVLAPDVTLFGVWGTADEVWVVGTGSAARSWRVGAQADEVPEEIPVEAESLFKVWGSDEGVWAVGDGVFRWDDGWVRESSAGPLFTVHSGVAVGGLDAALMLERDGSTWTDVSPAAPPLSGVFRRDGCPTAAVGRGGTVLVDGQVPAAGLPTVLDLHAVRVEEDCSIWVVGGALSSAPATHGVLAVLGGEPVPTLEDDRQRLVEPPDLDDDDHFISASATCEDDLRTVRVTAIGRPSNVTLGLHGPADYVETVEFEPVSWEGQYAWTEWGIDLAIPDDSPLECKADAFYVFDIENGCAALGAPDDSSLSDCQSLD
ncbi:MAG: hypothetical protein GY913_20935 [Proteobacteria bacterium]|nr:hypothetical protein [Pseudomonadota bacterium]MCP4919373.1 hypothetical protein [Pseudomonadota bacterium]